MASKFIIFVVLATVAQSSSRLQQSLSSSELQNDYSKINNLYKSGLTPYLNSVVAIYDEIKQYLAQLAASGQIGTNGAVNLSGKNEKKTQMGQSFALGRDFDAIAIINPEVSLAITASRVIGETQIIALVTTIYTAIKFAAGLILPTEVLQIEVLQELQEVTIETIEEVAAIGGVTFVANIFAPLQDARNSNAKSGAAIQDALDKASCRVVNAIRAVFTAIKVLQAAVSDGTRAGAKAALSEVERIQRRGLSILRNSYRIEFDFFKSCLVADSLLEAIDFIDSTAISTSEDGAICKYKKLVKAVYTRIENYLDKVDSGNQTGTAAYFCTMQSTEEIASSGVEILTDVLTKPVGPLLG